MAISVNWDNEQHTIICYSFTEPWDWQDYDNAMRSGWEMMETVKHKVGVIVDLSAIRSLPRNAIKHLSSTAKYKHPNQGTLVFVGMNAFIQAIGNILTSLYPKKSRDVYSVKTLEQARALLHRQPWMRGLLRYIYN